MSTSSSGRNACHRIKNRKQNDVTAQVIIKTARTLGRLRCACFAHLERLCRMVFVVAKMWYQYCEGATKLGKHRGKPVHAPLSGRKITRSVLPCRSRPSEEDITNRERYLGDACQGKTHTTSSCAHFCEVLTP